VISCFSFCCTCFFRWRRVVFETLNTLHPIEFRKKNDPSVEEFFNEVYESFSAGEEYYVFPDVCLLIFIHIFMIFIIVFGVFYSVYPIFDVLRS